MQQDIPTSWLSLEPAIDPRPLTVTTDTSLIEAITIMGKAESSCVLRSLNIPSDRLVMSTARSSYLLVMEGSHLVGIFTAQTALQLIASGRNLATVTIAHVATPPPKILTPADPQDLFTALSWMRQHRISCLPVLSEQGQLRGAVTLASIQQALQLDELLKFKPLTEAMFPSVVQAPVTASVQNVAGLMVEHQVDTVVLMEPAKDTHPELNALSPAGILTERDIIQLEALNLNLSQITAEAVMISPVLCLAPSDMVLAANWEMLQYNLQRVLVSDTSGALLGILSPISCLLQLDLAEMRTTVEQLQQSIDEFILEKAELEENHRTSSEAESITCPTELLDQIERNRLLNLMALRIRESLDLDEILNTSVTEVRQFLQTDRVIIYHFNPDMSGTVVVESTAEGWKPALGSTIQDTCFGKDYAHLYKAGRIQVTDDIYTAGLTQCHIDILVWFDIRANLVVPIVQGDKLWGLLCAYHCSAPRAWREFEVDLLKQLATHIAIAIQQSELYEQVQAELVERKRAEEQLKVSLKEKEVLLKEIHHRVKNNLQIISSLLKLQSTYIKDEQGLAMFKDSQNRIRSMALIHEKLYQSKDLSRINFGEYIHDLSMTLLRSYNASSQSISLETNVNNIWLNIDTAIPCGLIVNELISNSLKHAFPTHLEKDNEICIKIDSSEQDKFTLLVSDNGIGLPADLDFQNTESLGLELVCTLAEQLDGTIEVKTEKGTTFKITFAEVGNIGRIQ